MTPLKWFPRIFRVGEMATSRIEAFSDGVFAIIITLLVLESISLLHAIAVLLAVVDTRLSIALYVLLPIMFFIPSKLERTRSTPKFIA